MTKSTTAIDEKKRPPAISLRGGLYGLRRLHQGSHYVTDPRPSPSLTLDPTTTRSSSSCHGPSDVFSLMCSAYFSVMCSAFFSYCVDMFSQLQ
jgi:hypothetical protein